MLDTLKSDNWEDFRQRYNHTYCWLVRGDERQFVYIKEIDQEKVQFSTGAGLSFTAKADSGATFEFIPVDRGWYNSVGGSILHMSRIPERQFRRGISDGNTLLADESLFTIDITYKKLHQVFTIPKQWDKPFQFGVANAISKHFACLSDGRLMFHNVLIGTVDAKRCKVDHSFVQEITDVFRRRGIPLEIEAVNV